MTVMANNRYWTSPFLRLTLYYLIVGAVAYGVVMVFPTSASMFSGERLQELAQGGGGFLTGSVGIDDSEASRGAMELALITMGAIIGCLILLAPVVWVYMVTKQQEGYDESVVHTVAILPIPVSALVIVVQDSLALAFSLAGIVAAVRFRNTLKDTKDAVYIFLTIGTALAAGVQALGIAAVATMMFNYIVLVMWQFKLGNIYADQLKFTPKMRLGDVLSGGGTPGAGTGQLTIGDPSMLAALTPDSLSEIAERKAKLRDHIETAGKGAKKYNGLLVVLGNGTEQTLDVLDDVLKQHTEKFKLAEITPTADGNSTLEYLIGLPSHLSGKEFIAVIRQAAGMYIVAAEFRNLALRKSKDDKTPRWTLPSE
jgi:hypothetical protein